MSPMPAQQTQREAQQQALEWFSRMRQPGCDDIERREFAAWCQDPLNAHAYAELEALWQHLQPPQVRPRPLPAKPRRSHLGKAMALLCLLLAGALVYLYWPLMQRWGSELHTEAGERRSVRLADGSTLHLDSASAMNVDLRSRTRQLQLVQGQVYLEVMLDGRAMDLQVDDARIQVFGSRLMVARHADHDEVVVINGKAMVIQGGDQRMVSSGERVTFNQARIDTVQKVDIDRATAWRSGALRVTDMPLGQVLERLAGYQGRRVWLMDQQAAYRRISGDFSLDRAQDSLDKLAAAQRLTLNGLLGHWLIVR
ncbi:MULTISPECIES: FecR domain-containing protein [Pseudomonas]|nr:MULTISPECIES: FecR domain-containing protein [Pseudomonas]MDT8922743.1 FecR domain-containing protein [Pseudomonas taiwanensis]WEZ87984.1 FecR domain-containing protein [Pseudomonas sp. NyZ480]